MTTSRGHLQTTDMGNVKDQKRVNRPLGDGENADLLETLFRSLKVQNHILGTGNQLNLALTIYKTVTEK